MYFSESGTLNSIKCPSTATPCPKQNPGLLLKASEISLSNSVSGILENVT